MIVDPFTGLPVEEGIQAQSLSGDIAIGAASSMGYEQGALLNAAAHFPTAITTMLWNTRRGGNTILRGGFSREGRRRAAAGYTGGGIYNHLMPRSFGRLSSVQNIDPVTAGRSDYSPFNILARFGNPVVSRAEKSIIRRANSEKGGKIATKLAGKLTNSEQAAFHQGTLSRMNAATRASRTPHGSLRTSGPIREMRARAVANAAKLDPVMQTLLDDPINRMHHKANSYYAIAGSGGGRYSQYIAGYGGGVTVGGPTGKFADNLAGIRSKEYLMRGSERAAKHLAAGGLRVNSAGKLLVSETGERAGLGAMRMAVAKGGLKTGAALGARAAMFSNPVTAAIGVGMLAYDLASIGSELLIGGMSTARDAVISMKGSIGKPVMGMGFKDNEVAATSRARGVHAIQNSRLNARSVLGNEAAGLAAHFG